MVNKTYIIALVSLIACVAMSVIALQLYKKDTTLDGELSQSHQIINKIQDEMDVLKSDKDKVLAQNEKLQEDSLSFVNSNSKLQQEKEEASRMFEAAKILLKRKETELDRAKQKLDVLTEKISNQQVDVDAHLSKEKNELEANVNALEATLKKERGLFHYNLAVAYTKAKLFDEAIEAYEKALAVDPGNADAHYNLGLLYNNVKNDPKKAAEHYKAYLGLKPDADDKDDVLELIDKLTSN